MRIAILCEYSGIVRDAFIKKGHNAISCDIIDSETKGPHFTGDALLFMQGEWDMIIAHPPCTYICGSGWFRSVHDPIRMEKSVAAIAFAKALWNTDCPKICMENPVGKLSKEIGKPQQYIQPYNFGHDASKKTCLWLKGIAPLVTGEYIEPRIVTINGKQYNRWANQTDSGQNKLPPSEDRGKIRSLTYQGWADAMAEQWG